ncbi:TonB-dependent receptor [Thiomicrorhabdus sediminis]|uniref:TonB-dependent receptor n=1 Tax=Thiomicrorhabdus sediminis TaxID=2580412 RepID=A0A4P9K672_9GAMM|nr:TonB-dependent receptor [Thiomicrorhabdus sediminis]QCU90564.1 TonB-dependent receptor [Thiomicrorhabdus sediminis]
MNSKLNPITIALLGVVYSAQSFAETSLNDITIGADLFESTQQDMPASVEVLTQDELQDQGANHFDDVLLKTPNVNFSGQSSRARHIQIRGMGERDEYTGAPNSSVGFAVDDIDFSGIGMTGNVFDTKQVEVLRGPQNTRYGQSAIGGLINIQTNDPTPYRESMIEASAGDDSLREFGLMTSGPINNEKDAAQYRFVMFKHQSDGFRHNETLGRSDTNGRDELTLRGKLRLFPNQHTTVDITALHADLNNGYDAWARDNSFTTLTNQPGEDDQLSNAASVKVVSTANPNFVLTSKTAIAGSTMRYSYDEDWTAALSGTYLNDKTRQTYSQELRFSSTETSKIGGNTDWLAGLYASKLDEKNQTEYWGSSSTDFSITKLSGFGQLDVAINDKTTVSTSLRVENNNNAFSNSNGEYYAPNETLWGASLSYSHRYNDKYSAYTSVTRGFKAGGFNPGQPSGTPSQYLSYDAETLINYEIGLKSHFAAIGLNSNITAFYMDRHNPQIDGYTYDPNSGTNWVFYTENFDSASSYGIEADFNWQVSERFTTFGSMGLMQTDVNGTPLNSGFSISNRALPHSPNYQINLGAKYRSSQGFYAQADITAVDKFYFDTTHNDQSNAYKVVNARIGYEANDYEVYLWAKNLTDERYATRGFYFDFNAPYTNPSEYERLGDPRQIGLTARVYF